MTSLLRPHAVVVAAAIMFVLVGCAPDEPSPVADPPASPTATAPAAPQARESGLVAPKQVFGGDCSVVLPGGILGAGSALQSFAEPFGPSGHAIPQRGGIACGWQSLSDTLHLIAVPEAAVSSVADSASCAPNTADAEWVTLCHFERATNGTRASGYLGSMLAQPEAQTVLEAALAEFDEAAAAATPVPAPIPAEGSWSNPVDCVGLAAAVDVAAFYNNTPGLERFDAGTGAVPIGVEDDIFDGPYALHCTWGTNVTLTTGQYASGMSRGFGADVLGGARWAESSVASRTDATEVTVPGVDKAFLVRGPRDTVTVLHLFSGVNYLAVSRDGGPGVDIGPSDYPLIAQLLDELDSTATD